MLQWVHGPQTVVMAAAIGLVIAAIVAWLQWVHGPQTVVMSFGDSSDSQRKKASMGPRSSDRGYAVQTVFAYHNIRASMGPRSSDRGYVAARTTNLLHSFYRLQWVHGPQTVVMC